MNTIAHSQTPANHMMAKSSAVTEWYQSVRRELWESRSLYLAPLIVSVLMVLAFLGRTIQLRANVDALVRGSASAREAIWQPYQSASLLMMGVTFITALFYCADALYGERRDRSILFWKSMPVSDTVTVIAKMSVAVIVLPVITIAAVIVVHLSMLLISSCVLAFSGGGVGSLWAHIPLVSMWTALCIHMLAGHGLWYAPAYAWLLLVS
ncbi:MAG TPA: ABC transporter permease, partial [Terriglobales bacterium]